MKKGIIKSSLILLLTSLSLGMYGCSTNPGEEKKIKYVFNFHIGEETIIIDDKYGKNIELDVEQENKRFLGWSLEKEGKDSIFSEETTLTPEEYNPFFLENTILDIYAQYANIATVTFHVDSPITYKIDSESSQLFNVPDVSKEGHEFKGWSLLEGGYEIVLDSLVTAINYSTIEKLLSSDYSLDLYPITKVSTKQFKLYNYSKAEEMAEIHIETENGLAIDDKSLENWNERKGKTGELCTYNYVNATISIDHCEADYVLSEVKGKVKVRGNYTSTYDKKPIRIKFDAKQKMLGLNNDNKLKNWVLLAEWKDSSLLRTSVANYLGNAFLESDGFYCSDSRFVKVYLNGKYNGVYCVVEQQEIDPNRLNIPESQNENDSYKTGYLLEYDGYYGNEPAQQKFPVSYSGIKNGNTGFTISNDINNDEQYNFIKKVTQNIWNVVYDAVKRNHDNLDANPYHTIDDEGNYIEDKGITSDVTAIGSVIDIDSLVNMYLIHDILQDRDIGWSSFYFTLDFSDKGNHLLTFNAPWDFDYAIGNNTFGNAMRANLKTSEMVNAGRLTRNGWNGYKMSADCSLTKDDFTFTNQTALYNANTDNPWFVLFSNCDWLWYELWNRWQEGEKAGVFTGLLEMLDFYIEKYEADFNENFEKWPQIMGKKLDMYQPDIINYFVNQKQAGQYLRIWLEERINGLREAYKNKFTQYFVDF